jgi:hypothetical protein
VLLAYLYFFSLLSPLPIYHFLPPCFLSTACVSSKEVPSDHSFSSILGLVQYSKFHALITFSVFSYSCLLFPIPPSLLPSVSSAVQTQRRGMILIDFCFWSISNICCPPASSSPSPETQLRTSVPLLLVTSPVLLLGFISNPIHQPFTYYSIFFSSLLLLYSCFRSLVPPFGHAHLWVQSLWVFKE